MTQPSLRTPRPAFAGTAVLLLAASLASQGSVRMAPIGGPTQSTRIPGTNIYQVNLQPFGSALHRVATSETVQGQNNHNIELYTYIAPPNVLLPFSPAFPFNGTSYDDTDPAWANSTTVVFRRNGTPMQIRLVNGAWTGPTAITGMPPNRPVRPIIRNGSQELVWTVGTGVFSAPYNIANASVGAPQLVSIQSLGVTSISAIYGLDGDAEGLLSTTGGVVGTQIELAADLDPSTGALVQTNTAADSVCEAMGSVFYTSNNRVYEQRAVGLVGDTEPPSSATPLRLTASAPIGATASTSWFYVDVGFAPLPPSTNVYGLGNNPILLGSATHGFWDGKGALDLSPVPAMPMSLPIQSVTLVNGAGSLVFSNTSQAYVR